MGLKENQRIEHAVSTEANNFFLYLKKRNCTQKKYASDNNMDNSTLSKWKTGASNPTVEQLKHAAEYFGITVNDLVYDDEQKKKLEVLADKSYDPIIAQQSTDVRVYDRFFNRPFMTLSISAVIIIGLGFILFIFRNDFPYLSLGIVLGIPLAFRGVHNHLYYTKTFIINYLDDIFYYRIDSANKKYISSLIVRVLSLMTIFYYITLLQGFELSTNQEKGLLLALLFLIMFLLFASIISITDLPKKFKHEIYDREIDAYNSSFFVLLIHLAIFVVAVLLLLYNLSDYLIFFVVSFVFLLLNVREFINLSLEYAKYVLMYQEDGKEPRELSLY